MASSVWGAPSHSRIIGLSRKGPRMTTQVRQNTFTKSFIGNSRIYNTIRNYWLIFATVKLSYLAVVVPVV